MRRQNEWNQKPNIWVLAHFGPFLPLQPSFDCMKVMRVVPEQFPGSSECFRVHLTILGLLQLYEKPKWVKSEAKYLDFWPILADFFIPSRNTFFYVCYLWMNSIFFKKVKIALWNQIFPRQLMFFLAFSLKFWSHCTIPFFFRPILADFLIPSKNMLI